MTSKDNSVTGRHSSDLSLMRLGREMRRRVGQRAPLVDVLRDAARRVDADAAMLWMPACGLRVPVTVKDAPLDPAIAIEFGHMPERINAQHDAPESLARVVQGEEGGVGCRLLIVSLDTGSPRSPAWLVFARTLLAPRFDTLSAVMAQIQALRLVRRLLREVDLLTGHLSRFGLRTVIAHREQSGGSLLLAELDGLRQLHHTRGIAGGDEAIAAFGRLLTAPLLPDGSLVAHLDSGKFAIVVPVFDSAGAVRIVERIQHALGSVVLEGETDAARLSCTCGIVEYDFTPESLDQALLAADLVLELAEEGGRSRIETRQHDDATLIRRQHEDFAASDLLEAIASGQLELHAQPIVSLRDDKHPLGFELLLKLRGMLGRQEQAYPARLIEVAQRHQLLPVLDRYVVDQAFAILTPYREVLARQRISVSINVSGQSLCDQEFTSHFIEELRRSRIAPSCIVVEVTEQVALANLARAGDAMRRLRAAGCGIAIDDFGTGANSLAYVHQLPVTRLKIDGSFIRDITTNKRSEAAVKGIVQLARDFVLHTVGEHVETAEQSELLRRLGVDFGQGYLFGKAEQLDAAMATLMERESAATSMHASSVVLDVG
jgi:diguanylate cyclase (GGDEF)-like protein